MKVRLLTKTVGAEGTEYENKSIDELIVGIARLSSSRETNDLFEEPHKLLRHCLWNSHWSIFGEANLGFEITTSRAMGRELLRHFSLKPQEVSQRYKVIDSVEPVEVRMQSRDNRQSSTEVFDPTLPSDDTASHLINKYIENGSVLYNQLLDNGVARECARMILPETTQTVLIMNGSIRDWITTLNQRLHKTAQKEVRIIAEEIARIFTEQCPIISKMLFDFEDSYDIHILERILLEKYGVYESIKENNFKKLK